MSKKVTIELRPYDALGILSFLREYINDSNRNNPMLAALHESVNAYEKEIYNKVTSEMVDDAELERSVNTLTRRQPE